MSAQNKIHIVGIGDDGLEGITAAARSLIDEATLILGTEKLLARINRDGVKKITITVDLSVVPQQIADHADEKIVILATGDPLFYGVARYLCEQCGKDRFDVVPHVSSMQLAFARVKESWEEAYLTDLANQHLDHVVERIRTTEKAGLFTTEATPPAAVGRALLDRGIDYFTAFVCENLGSPDERVTHAELKELASHQFSSLNVMILVRKPNAPDRPREMIGHRLFGNPDEDFLQSQPKRGLLTPAEVRAIALSALDLGPASTVWDVGAGSGAVAIEAAQLAPNGRVYAIEMDAEDHQLIMANAERFGVANLVPVLGEAPSAWEKLPDPDAIFVGGAGRHVRGIVEEAFVRLRDGGRLVANVGSVENLAAVHECLQKASNQAQVWMVNVSRGTEQLDRLRFESLNPTFLVGAVKG
ncbi:MAG: precorrin-6y C5,15-methyltransferase (decarboxylating) subunit CbiE [Pirellulaceae bacterium]|nr:precorrin-6y C5,15-methyltransferase (decarboxylating) subunit CbiE [Pirellulaceae bacterium]